MEPKNLTISLLGENFGAVDYWRYGVFEELLMIGVHTYDLQLIEIYPKDKSAEEVFDYYLADARERAQLKNEPDRLWMHAYELPIASTLGCADTFVMCMAHLGSRLVGRLIKPIWQPQGPGAITRDPEIHLGTRWPLLTATADERAYAEALLEHVHTGIGVGHSLIHRKKVLRNDRHHMQ